jgi:hypothetical protein
MRENSDFAMKINEINLELSGNSQRYVNECCVSESDGRSDGFGAGCCKRRGGVAIAVWCTIRMQEAKHSTNDIYQPN